MDIEDDEYQHQAQQHQRQHVPPKTQKFQRAADRKMNFNNHESARGKVEKQATESNQRKINRENAMSSEERQDQSRKSERVVEHDRRANLKNVFNNDEKQVHSNALNGQQQRTRNFEQANNENERRMHFKNTFKGQDTEAQQSRTRNFEQVNNENERRTNGNAAKNSHGNQLDTSHQVNEGTGTKRRGMCNIYFISHLWAALKFRYTNKKNSVSQRINPSNITKMTSSSLRIVPSVLFPLQQRWQNTFQSTISNHRLIRTHPRLREIQNRQTSTGTCRNCHRATSLTSSHASALIIKMCYSNPRCILTLINKKNNNKNTIILVHINRQ